jgi:hypothetical protein
VYPLDQLAFVIGLAKDQAEAEPRAIIGALPFDVRERGVAIDMRLPLAKEV